MEARQLSKACQVMAVPKISRVWGVARGALVLLTLLGMTLEAQAQTKLKLPQTSEQYRQLAEESASPVEGGRKGTVQRVSSEKVSIAADAPEPNSTLQTLPGKTEVAPAQITLNAQGKAATPPTERQYRVVVRWEDGSFGEVLVKQNPHLRAGDRVSVDGGKITRLPPDGKR